MQHATSLARQQAAPPAERLMAPVIEIPKSFEMLVEEKINEIREHPELHTHDHAGVIRCSTVKGKFVTEAYQTHWQFVPVFIRKPAAAKSVALNAALVEHFT